MGSVKVYNTGFFFFHKYIYLTIMKSKPLFTITIAFRSADMVRKHGTYKETDEYRLSDDSKIKCNFTDLFSRSTMGKLDKTTGSEIKNTILISNILKQYVKIRAVEDLYVSSCPFCSEIDKLQINDQKKIFKCYECGVAGDLITFVMLYRKIDYKEAILEIQKLH